MNKKYDVYAIGNALVDIEFEVNDDEIKKLGVDKGVMTLVDEPRQDSLMTHVHGVAHSKSCGGSAANTAVAIAQLGGKSFYSCQVANDEMGKFFIEDLCAEGVDTNLSVRNLPNGKTGKCLCFVTPDAERTMNTFLGITQELHQGSIDHEALKNSFYLYIEGYLVASKTAKAAAIKARELAQATGVKTSITFSDPNMVKYFSEGLLEMIGDGVDLIFCNEAEALTFACTDSLMVAGEALAKYAKSFVITRGKNGALIYENNRYIKVDAFEVNVVDTLGAGDTFAGAYLYAITHHHTAVEAGQFACYVASELIQSFGPRLSKEKMECVYEKAKRLLRRDEPVILPEGLSEALVAS